MSTVSPSIVPNGTRRRQARPDRCTLKEGERERDKTLLLCMEIDAQNVWRLLALPAKNICRTTVREANTAGQVRTSLVSVFSPFPSLCVCAFCTWIFPYFPSIRAPLPVQPAWDPARTTTPASLSSLPLFQENKTGINDGWTRTHVPSLCCWMLFRILLIDADEQEMEGGT